jgi:hypothetical protein
VKYKKDLSGLREIGKSPGMAAAMLEVGQRLAGNANAVGESTYEAANTTVTVGWDNDRRAGAVVRESEHHWRDSRDAILLRVRDSMTIRGRR